MKRIGDLLCVGLILISLFIIALSLAQPNVLIKLIGLIGGLVTIVVEIYALKEILK